MEIVNCEQGTPEWFQLREKRLTASHGQEIAANGKGLITYINKIMQEYFSTAEPDSFTSAAMERGNELESSARFAYEVETGLEVEQVGFIVHDEYSGASPDGMIDDDGLMEIKCPGDKVYFQYLLDKKIDTKYIAQMQCQLLMSKRKWCDFVTYNPNFKQSLIIQRVEADPVIFTKLTAGLLAGRERIIAIQKQFEGVL